MRIEDYQNDPNWISSIGEKLDKIHFRNGHLHAECDPTTGNCTIHYDKHDPSESIPELAKHVWDSNLGKSLIIGGGITAAILAIIKSK